MMGVLLFILMNFAAAEEIAVTSIEETRSEISQTEKEQREQLAQLFVINQKIKDIAKKRARLNESLLSQEANVRSLAQDVSELEDKSDKHKQMLNQRLRQLYQGRKRNDFEWLFSAQTPVELERNHRFLRRMIDSDHKYVRDYLAHLDHLKKKKNELNRMVSRLLGMQKNVQAQETELSEQMRHKSRLVAELRRAKDNKLSQLKSLRSQGVGQNETLDYAFFERKGSLRAPVEAPLAREYGTFVDSNYRFRLMHKGNFYSTKTAVPVTAIFSGKVVLARKIPGLGQTVILDHGDNYYSVYSFASRLKVREGAEIKEGTELALSGQVSPLFGPGLYFEIRHFTDAIDPRPWIKESVIKTAQGGR